MNWTLFLLTYVTSINLVLFIQVYQLIKLQKKLNESKKLIEELETYVKR